MKSLPTEQEKIFANNMPDKGLIYNLYKELLQLHFKDTNKKLDLKKWAEDLNRHFPKENREEQEAHEQMSTSLIREM